MSQTRPCVECHEPDLADSDLARQGLRWGSARRRLAIGSYVCGRSLSPHLPPFFYFFFFSRTHRIHLVLSLLLQLASINSFWILKYTSKVWESTHACVVKFIRAWLPSQASRGGLASRTHKCMSTLKMSIHVRVRLASPPRGA